MRNTILKLLFLFALLVLFIPASPVAADDDLSMQQLLQQVREGRNRDAQANRQREAEFRQQSAQQSQLINDAEKTLKALEAESVKLEKQFNKNETLLDEKRRQRDERLGALKELFGHLTAAAGDFRSEFRHSITHNQFPDRAAFLSELIRKMNSDTDLPSVEDIEHFWFLMHQELTESGQVVKYSTKIGTEAEQPVLRIGLFNLLSAGDYLAFNADTGSVSRLPRQPHGYTAGAMALESANSGVTAVGIDPTGAAGGAYLQSLIHTPDLVERWHQGKIVGYLISGLGAIGVLLALWRFVALSVTQGKINRQIRHEELRDNNPLGRVLSVGGENPLSDTDTLELKLGEAIIRERPKIESGLSLLKIIAMIAPLMGLLGTVVGMIIVFQAITIYGAGDPKAMAGGISSALVTTVLGLIVAIPILLLHTLLQGKARKILHVLEQQSAGILAERAAAVQR